MEICPKCGKPTEAKDKLTVSKMYPINQIKCSCGYYGLPIEVKKDDSKKD